METREIDPTKYGVSFSLKQCRNFSVDPRSCLDWLLAQGWRRFRLMSYWDEHEKTQGVYDFSELDWQLDAVAKVGGVVTLCLGVKQPRWPEYHWPEWTKGLSQDEITSSLLMYISAVIEYVRHREEIETYQLENEALLRNFGEHIVIDKPRLRAEYALLKQLDPTRPIVMSTSNNWGIPLRAPRPDIVGFSVYTIIHANGMYHRTEHRPWVHRIRRKLTHLLLGRPVFIHELQLEPWGPQAIWEMSREEQARSMDVERIQNNIDFARRIGVGPIDMWGGEWWYWCWLSGDPTIAQAVNQALQSPAKHPKQSSPPTEPTVYHKDSDA